MISTASVVFLTASVPAWYGFRGLFLPSQSLLDWVWVGQGLGGLAVLGLFAVGLYRKWGGDRKSQWQYFTVPLVFGVGPLFPVSFV